MAAVLAIGADLRSGLMAEIDDPCRGLVGCATLYWLHMTERLGRLARDPQQQKPRHQVAGLDQILEQAGDAGPQ